MKMTRRLIYSNYGSVVKVREGYLFCPNGVQNGMRLQTDLGAEPSSLYRTLLSTPAPLSPTGYAPVRARSQAAEITFIDKT